MLYLFWYFDVFCKKCAYLSLNRESKREVGNLEILGASSNSCNTSSDRRRPATTMLVAAYSGKIVHGMKTRPATARQCVATTTQESEASDQSIVTAGQDATVRCQNAMSRFALISLQDLAYFATLFPYLRRGDFSPPQASSLEIFFLQHISRV